MAFKITLAILFSLVAFRADAAVGANPLLLDVFPVTEAVNLELRVEVEENGARIEASGVVRFVISASVAALGSGGLSMRLEGDALAIEGTSPLVFATLDGATSFNGFVELAAEECGLYGARDLGPFARLEPLRSFSGPCELSWRAYPMFVRQQQNGRWEQVGAGEDEPNLKPDIRVRRVTLARSTAPVTRQITSYVSFSTSDRFLVEARPRDRELLSTAFKRGRP